MDINRRVYRLFLFVLIFSPLAFGTVELWSYAIMETIVFIAFWFLLADRQSKNKALYEVPGILPLTLFLLYILFQLIPLPAGFVKLISPSTYSLYNETVGLVEPIGWISLSINKKATLSEFFRYLTYVIFFILTVQLLTGKERLKKTVEWIIIFAAILSIMAILQRFTADGRIFWLREAPSKMPFGPYVNRNHYAGFMGMVFPLVFCLFLYYKPEVSLGSFRARLAAMFNQQRTHIYILLGFSGLLMVVSVFVSLSRGGIISLCLSLSVLCIMIFKKDSYQRGRILPFLMIFLVLLCVGWFGWEPVFERFEKIRDTHGNITEGRLLYYWKDSVDAAKQFPVTGTGFGTFEDIYRSYQTFPGKNTVDHAHNDYLELVTTGGVIAVILLAWFLITLLVKTYKAFKTRREPYSVLLYLGSMAGIIYILAHSVSDFNLQIGANGLYFFFLCGLLVSSANTRLRVRRKRTNLNRLKRPVDMRFSLPAMAAVTACLVLNLSGLIGKSYFSHIKDTQLHADMPREDLLRVNSFAYKASLYDPLEPGYCFAVGNSEAILSSLAVAKKYYVRALDLNPTNSGYLQRLGLLLAALGDHVSADRMLEAAVNRDVNNPERYRVYGSMLLSGFSKEGEPITPENKERGIEMIQKAISLDSGFENIDKCLAVMIRAGLSEDDIKSAIPGMAAPHILMAEYYETVGMDDMARDAYHDALEYIRNEEKIDRRPFYKVYSYYMRKKQYKDALTVMLKAIEALPDDVHIRYTAGRLYEKLGIVYRAKEEYGKALLIDPGYKRARDRLGRLG